MKLRFMTNEEYFEVSEQPEPTCPMLDFRNGHWVFEREFFSQLEQI